MKKWIALLLVAVMCLCTGCFDSLEPAESSEWGLLDLVEGRERPESDEPEEDDDSGYHEDQAYANEYAQEGVNASYGLPIIDGSGLTGQYIDLAATGKPTVVLFWSAWNDPDSNQLTLLEDIADQYGDSVCLVAIHGYEAEDSVLSYIAENFQNSEIIFAWDQNGEELDARQYFPSYTIDRTPFIILLNESGNATLANNDPALSYNDLCMYIDELLYYADQS